MTKKEQEQMPAGWVPVKLREAVQPRSEKVAPMDYSGTKFLGMDHVEAHTTKILGSVPSENLKSHAARFYPGDVLYGRLRPYLNKVALPGFNGLASAEFIVLPENALITAEFLLHRLNSRDFADFATHLNEGDRPRVNFSQIGEFDLLIPPAQEQQRIVAKIQELFSQLDAGIASLKAAREQLNAYRQALLKDAFEGKLTAQWRVDHAEQLESTEKLLSRIQDKHEALYKKQLERWEQSGNPVKLGLSLERPST